MTEQRVTTKADLMAELDLAWAKLNTALDRLSESQKTILKDTQGWTVKDHIIHMIYWERSAVFFLQGKTRHAGLDVDEELYQKGSEDEINAAIFQKHHDLPLAGALEQFRDVHRQLMALLQPLTDNDLQKRYRAYLPDEPGEGDGPPALNVVYGNSAHHYTEHLAWIEALVDKSA